MRDGAFIFFTKQLLSATTLNYDVLLASAFSIFPILEDAALAPREPLNQCFAS